MSSFSVNGRTVFVTGAARGIGAESARRLHAKGANVALVGLEPDLLEELAAELGDRAEAFEADVTDADALERAVDDAVERFGGIDVAIANAGINMSGTVAKGRLEAIERVLDVNLMGVWRTDRAVLPQIIERKGYLLNIASLAAVSHAPMMAPYATAKAGVEALSNCLRQELALTGARVGCAYFGFIDTDLVRAGFEEPSAQVMRKEMPGFLTQDRAAVEGGRRDRGRRRAARGARVGAAVRGPDAGAAGHPAAAHRAPRDEEQAPARGAAAGRPRARRRRARRSGARHLGGGEVRVWPTSSAAIVGSGFGGLGAAIRLREEGIEDFVVLEREHDVGGTWRENTYPGCACDVPSHLYSYSFAPQPRLEPQLRPAARDPRLPPRDGRAGEDKIRFGAEVQAARWDDEQQRWLISTPQGDFRAKALRRRHRPAQRAQVAGRRRASRTSRARCSTPPSGTTRTTSPASAWP